MSAARPPGAVAGPVPSMPLLHLRDLWAVPGPLPYPLGEPGVTRWYNARAAIWQGLRSLGLAAGSRVIAPAYTCGSELDVLVHAGLQLDFFRIGADLCADLAHLETLCQTPAQAIFVTHYYGLPQPMAQIAAIARRHGLLLIEDASHALGSTTPDGQPLGSFGDMAVFSLWKSLAVPDGGVLRLRPEAMRLPLPAQGERPGLASVAGRLRHMLEETLATQHPAAVRALRRHVTDPLVQLMRLRLAKAQPLAQGSIGNDGSLPPEAAQIAFRSERRAWRMTPLSSHLLPRLARAGMASERRANFRSLAQQLRPGPAVQPLIKALPAHTCPLLFPLVAIEPRAFCRHLAAHGVGFFRGWCVFHPHIDWTQYALEAHLKEHVVVVPVHQGLSAADLTRMAQVINAWNEMRQTEAVGGKA